MNSNVPHLKMIPWIIFYGSAVLFATMDIYVPSLPMMQEYFSTTEDMMQWTLTVNFMGSAIIGLFLGPLSDFFGRKRIIIIGLIVYFIGSFLCVQSQNIELFLFGRLLQSFGSSAQSVISLTIITDLFFGRERAKMLSIIGIIFPVSFALAPIVGGKLQVLYGWQSSFIAIGLCVFVYFLLFCFYVPETLHTSKRVQINLKKVFADYKAFFKSRVFISYASVQSLTIAIFMLYLANAPFFYMRGMGMSPDQYSFFQAAPFIVQILGTFFARDVLAKQGMNKAFLIGAYIYALGFVAFLLSAFFFATNPYIVCLAACFPYVGSAFVFAVAISKAMELFPHLAGTSSAVFAFLRTIIGAAFLGFGTQILDTSVLQVYIFMSSIMLMILGLIVYLLRTNLKAKES